MSRQARVPQFPERTPTLTSLYNEHNGLPNMHQNDSDGLMEEEALASPPPQESVPQKVRRKAHQLHVRNGPPGTRRKMLMEALTHPKNTLREARSRVPDEVTKEGGKEVADYLPQSAFSLREEEEFIRAWDDLAESIKEDVPMEEVEVRMMRIRELERRRNNLRLKWTLRRHVRELNLVTISRPVSFPDTNKYVLRNLEGKPDFLFAKWLEDVIQYLTADFASYHVDPWKELPPVSPIRLHSIVERLLAASSPWQEWVLSVRRLYRWEDPWKTFGWFCTYNFLLWIRLLPQFFIGYIVIQTLSNGLLPSQKALKDSVTRSKSTHENAQDLFELMEQHKDGSWVYSIAEAVGPTMQLQIYDLACLLEILRNFHEWRRPYHTGRILIMLIAGAIALKVVPLRLVIEAIGYSMGLIFFFIFPISSHLPRYRLLFSPVRWLFWGIPDDVEWTLFRFKRDSHKLQEKGPRQVIVDSNVTMELDPASRIKRPVEELHTEFQPREDVYFFPCFLNGRHGHVELALTTLVWYPDNPSGDKLVLNFKNVVHIHKRRPESKILDGLIPVPGGDEEKKGSVFLVDYCNCKWRFTGLNVSEEEVLVRRVVGAGEGRWAGGV